MESDTHQPILRSFRAISFECEIFYYRKSQKAGFEAIDMDTYFFPRFRATNERYDFPPTGIGMGLATNWRQRPCLKVECSRVGKIGMSRSPEQ